MVFRLTETGVGRRGDLLQIFYNRYFNPLSRSRHQRFVILVPLGKVYSYVSILYDIKNMSTTE